MAKPGSNGARAIARGGVDLGGHRLTDDQAAHRQEKMELTAGMRCWGCGRRISIGFRFSAVSPRDGEITKLTACSRDDCGYAEALRDDATVMEAVEFAWLDEAGLDAPPARDVLRINDAKAAALDAEEAAGKAEGEPG
jgi:hypothetical protein